MKSILWSFLGLFVMLFILSCEKENGSDPENDDSTDTLSTDTLKIHSFVFHETDPPVEAEIDHENKEIKASIPPEYNIKNIAITVEFTEGATLTPPSGFAYDFSTPLDFTLKKDQETSAYTALIDYAENDQNELLSVTFPDLFQKPEITDNEIYMDVPYGTDLSEVLIELNISPEATSDPPSGSMVDISPPFSITITAENGDENIYTLYTTTADQETGVRAFWIPDPSHSPFLTSYEDMQEGVALAKELNFNTLYAVAWAKTRTLYPSQVLADHSTYTTDREGMFSPDYPGDPLEDLIEIAHAEGLKVILWYEYGFMARWGAAPTPNNDRLLAVNPEWVGINNQGQPSNYNGTDFYYNAYNTEVQQFMLDLIMEAVNNYNIDGIQGDDRLPAMPRNSGYDDYTINKYKEEHGGEDPPSNFNATAWVNWRAEILNNFGEEIFNTVKAAKPDVLVTNSPNPYPWAFQNLMQEWPEWLDAGAVEILSVQCYRYNISAYRSTINEVKSYFTSHGDGNMERLSPGIILYGSQGLTDPELIVQKMRYNRSIGITGESFFYDVPLKDERIKRVMKAMYPGPAIFPEF